MTRNKIIFAVLLLSFLFFSCSKNNSIVGKWENEDRILSFSDYGDFEIEYKNPKTIKSFRGSTAIKKNLVVLIFDEYQTSDNQWHFTDETELKGFKEILLVSVEKDVLITEIKATGKKFEYKKIE
ncbi:hypothetical protein [Treponema pectinovorum]|uniref:hypothetical protein n=1 Tax=Treponema pectinovorum TaxID=164 RepID=UPI0011C7CA21|nr:hypothetical protein [Treponema pectinovorum]